MASSPLSEQEIAALVGAIQQNLTNTYVNISAISFLVYDILINLSREIEHVWRSRWSISKVLFLFGRYYGLLFTIINFSVTTKTGLSLEFCKAWLWYNVIGGEILFATVVNVILTMRLYAVYQNRKVLAMFIVLLICEFAVELYVCITMGIQTTRTASVLPSSIGIAFPGCIASADFSITLLSWIPCMVVATVFFIMTIVKAISEGYTTPKRLMDIKRISPLIVLIVRDGALFYCLMFAILLLNTILTVQASQGTAADAPMPWLIAIYSLTASRLVLNLREEASRPLFGVTTGGQSMIEPVFAMNPIERRVGLQSSTSL